jgi:hypothetical protein
MVALEVELVVRESERLRIDLVCQLPPLRASRHKRHRSLAADVLPLIWPSNSRNK